MGSSSRRVLYHSTHSRLADSTASKLRQGPRRWVTSALKMALTVSARALMLLCPSSGLVRARAAAFRSAEVAEDLAGHVPLQAPHDLPLRPSLSQALLDVGERRLVASHAGDDDPVERGVRLPIAAPVQPMARRLPARRRDRTDAAQLGKRRL